MTHDDLAKQLKIVREELYKLESMIEPNDMVRREFYKIRIALAHAGLLLPEARPSKELKPGG